MLSLKRATTLAPVLKAQLPILSEVSSVQKRNGSNLAYGHLAKYGQGGRNSFNGKIATVFGATGFMGRYVVNRLALSGTQIIVPYRGAEDKVRDMRLLGDLGQIMFLPIDIRDYDSLKRCCSYSNVVINMIGRHWSNWNFTMKEINADAAESVARAAAESGVHRLVHVSHLMAKHDSPVELFREKAAGEERVRAQFPMATLVKPSDCYGDEDRYLNRMAFSRKLPGPVPLVDGGWNTIKRPVFMPDVAQGIINAAFDDTTAGKNVELYGPEAYYLYDMFEYVYRILNHPWDKIDISMKLYKALGWVGEHNIWRPKLTRDMCEREYVSETVSADALTFDDVGITAPTNLNSGAVLQVIRRHREHYVMENEREDTDVIRPTSQYD